MLSAVRPPPPLVDVATSVDHVLVRNRLKHLGGGMLATRTCRDGVRQFALTGYSPPTTPKAIRALLEFIGDETIVAFY